MNKELAGIRFMLTVLNRRDGYPDPKEEQHHAEWQAAERAERERQAAELAATPDAVRLLAGLEAPAEGGQG